MKRLLPALVATIILVALVLAFLDLRPGEISAAVGRRLIELSPGFVALALLVYACSYIGRAIRLSILLPGATGIVHLASVSGRHNFLNLVLPFRSGEVALPWMLKQEAGRPLAEGTAALLVCRVLDLLCVAAYMAVGLAWYGLGGSTSREVAPRVAAVIVVLLLGLALLRPIARLGIRWLGDGDGRMRSFLRRAAVHLTELSFRRLAAATATSLVTWLFTYATFYFLVQAMAGPDDVGMELAGVGFPRSLVGTTGLHLSTVLPVNTVGGFGSWEIGWVSGYVLLAGLGKEASGISAVVSHLAVFGFITLIGGLGFALRKRPEATTG